MLCNKSGISMLWKSPYTYPFKAPVLSKDYIDIYQSFVDFNLKQFGHVSYENQELFNLVTTYQID